MLMDTELPAYQIALPIIIALAVFSAGLLALGLGMIVRARKRALVTGLDHLLHTAATVESVRDGKVWVRLDGELWAADSSDTLATNDEVIIESIDELTLNVRKNTGR